MSTHLSSGSHNHACINTCVCSRCLPTWREEECPSQQLLGSPCHGRYSPSSHHTQHEQSEPTLYAQSRSCLSRSELATVRSLCSSRSLTRRCRDSGWRTRTKVTVHACSLSRQRWLMVLMGKVCVCAVYCSSVARCHVVCSQFSHTMVVRRAQTCE
jgi:hypothetical protein